MHPDTVMFPLSPGVKPRIEENYAAEADAARAAGLDVVLLDHDAACAGRFEDALRRLPTVEGTRRLLYRGWMLRVEHYAGLLSALRTKGYEPLTGADDYAACHELPGWYGLVEDLTPRSRWIAHGPPFDEVELRGLLSGWAGPLVLKDYVKSEKHAWKEACFIPDPSDHAAAARVVARFLELRGDGFEGGLVVREFVPLRRTGIHPRSGMPLSEEIRTFWARGRLIAAGDYWGDAALSGVPAEIREAARRVDRPFFTVDGARREDGGWIVMEVGDGQVSALPDAMSPAEFYRGWTAEPRG